MTTPGTLIASGYYLTAREQQSLAKRIDAEIALLQEQVDHWANEFAKASLQKSIAQAEIAPLVEALEGLADVVELDCEVPPCIGSMAPGEHYLGLARAAIAKAKQEEPQP